MKFREWLKEKAKRFTINNTDYIWKDGGLYVEGGDTLLPPYEGKWAYLEDCKEKDAKKIAKEWEKQR